MDSQQTRFEYFNNKYALKPKYQNKETKCQMHGKCHANCHLWMDCNWRRLERTMRSEFFFMMESSVKWSVYDEISFWFRIRVGFWKDTIVQRKSENKSSHECAVPTVSYLSSRANFDFYLKFSSKWADSSLSNWISCESYISSTVFACGHLKTTNIKFDVQIWKKETIL